MSYIIKERHNGGGYLSSMPYGFTGGYFSRFQDRAITFTSLEAADRAGRKCFNCGRLEIIDTATGKPVAAIEEE